MNSSKIIDIIKPIGYDENPERYRSISAVVVSDTHKKHEKIQIPDVKKNNEIPRSVIDFNRWLGTLPHKHKIVNCGNHELGFENLSKERIQSKLLTNCIYLKDELIQVEGITIYGCAWQFNGDYETKWSLIPSDIDILMTHIPPQLR
ncbi:unnamed protein product, partial [Rotaria socialis]